MSDHFDKILLAILFVGCGTAVVILAHWGVDKEIVTRIEDAFTGIMGALIALMTQQVFKQPKQ